jgi:ATP synthase protein I
MSDPGKEREDAELHERLRALKSAIAKEKTEVVKTAAEAQVGPAPATSSGLAQGLRVASELVAGVLAGGLIGYLLDRQFSTAPWLMLLCLLLGSAGGMNNVYKLGSKPTRFDDRKDGSRGG